MRQMVLLFCLVACEEPAGTVTAPHAGLAAGNPVGVPAGSPTGTSSGTPTGTVSNGCPEMMARVDGSAGAFCIDRYEATLEDWSPYDVPTGGQIASVGPDRVPQGYISGDAAAEACELAGKRLCALSEWLRACQGPAGSTYPYGDTYDESACNTSRASHPVVDLFGADTDWSSAQMNDPRVNQQADTVDPGGANPDCVSAEGVFDLHGNLHEWVADASGVFKGGFYADASINGPGCLYTTTAHTTTYHDYSTGFRCCADPAF